MHLLLPELNDVSNRKLPLRKDFFMKIILCRRYSICEPGIIKSLKRLGHEVVELHTEKDLQDYDKNYMFRLAAFIQDNPDAKVVFSVCFAPIIARACKPFGIPYISYMVDCPCSTLYSNTIVYPHNRLFYFDKLQMAKFEHRNPNNSFHTLLACDLEHFDSITLTQADHARYDADISFVGSLYSEKNSYDDIVDKLPAYIKGYVEGLCSAQQNVFGYNFIEDAISDKWVSDFVDAVGFDPLPDDYETDLKGIIADDYISCRCTELERIHILDELSKRFDVKLYTQSNTSMLPHVQNCGIADSERVMPKIFKCSKINLNMTLRSIKSGIPQRAFDIMGCGGFLMSNYQPELAEYFIPGEDLVLYDSVDDLIQKIDYYVSHEEERLQIAKNGYEKVKRYHTYDTRLTEILNTVISD